MEDSLNPALRSEPGPVSVELRRLQAKIARRHRHAVFYCTQQRLLLEPRLQRLRSVLACSGTFFFVISLTSMGR